jgi:hypothetical protein
MIPNISIEALGRKSEHLVELGEEHRRNSHPVEDHEASYRSWRTPSKAAGGARGTQTEQRTEVQQAPSRSEELTRDSFLRFRDQWVRNRARAIQQAGSISFRTCSEDTASITALNEFYRWRVFEHFKEYQCDKKELEAGIIQGPRDFGTLPKDVPAIRKLHICRNVDRENGRRVSKNACRRRAESRV